MYTLEELQSKTFKELKEIGWQLDVLPAGDRRCRQNWIDAIAGVNSPLLELLEVSPGVEVESVAEAIEVQHQEPIEQATKNSLGVKVDSVDDYLNCPTCGTVRGLYATCPGRESVWENCCIHCDYLEPSIRHPFEDVRPFWIDRVSEPIAPAPQIPPGVTFSSRFLARYSPPQLEIHYKADTDGQLNLLDFEIESADEPPDPDDFESMFAFWAAYDAWCERTDDDSEQFEPFEISLTSMCEWAPCPIEWYEPETIETIETVSCTLEISPLPIASSSTCNFSIPTFDAWCDRPNRQNDKDEPPDTGIFARLPGPKPPKFPPMVVAAGDRTNGKKFARSATLLSGRAPPGGDAM